MYTDARNDII